jgi:hypothetical protein
MLVCEPFQERLVLVHDFGNQAFRIGRSDFSDHAIHVLLHSGVILNRRMDVA